jgi:MFS family permease
MRLFTPLKNSVFRYLFFAQVISLLGTGLATVALALLVYEQFSASAGIILGGVLAIKMVAYLLTAPIAGAYANRLPRKAWLLSLNIIRAFLVLALPLVSELWQLVVLIFVLNVITAGYTPVYQALLPDVLENDELYTQGLSLSRLAMDVEALLSPVIAAALLLSMSYTWLFGLNALAFAMAAVFLLVIRIPSMKPSERTGGIWQQLTFGVRSYWSTPRLKAVLYANLAMSAAGAMIIVNTVIYVRANLLLPDEYVALLMAAAGAGSMLGAVVVPSILSVFSDRLVMLAGGTVSGLAMLLAGLIAEQSPAYLMLFPIWLLVGIGSAFVLIVSGRLVRDSCNKSDRNDYFAANFSLTHGMWLICYLLAGVLGSLLGLTMTFIVIGCIALVATGFSIIVWPKNAAAGLWHEHPEMNHQHPHVHDAHHQHEHQGWEGPEPHVHPHYHAQHTHKHRFVIDEHHVHWPRQS